MGSSFSVSTIFLGKDRMSPMFKKMGRSASTFGNIVSGILGAQIIQKGFHALTQGAKSFVTEAQKIEDATAGFTPLLGGVEKATMLVNRLNKEAATTPFQFEGISSVAKQLLPVMNGSIEKTADTFRMLGDTAGGNIQKLESITRGYTKSLLKGRPDMESLNMISEAGVPIFAEMAKTMGVTVNQLFALSKQGKLTNADLTKTFQNMTKEGGIFFNGMQIASETLTGRISTLKDNIALTAASIGSALLPKIKSAVSFFINIASKVRVWIDANRELIASKLDLFIEKVRKVLKVAVPIVKTIFMSIVDLSKSVFNVVRIIVNMFIPAQKKSNDTLSTLTDIINIAVKAVTSLINIVGILIQKNKALGVVVNQAIGIIKLFGVALSLLNFIINPTADNFDLLKVRLQSLWMWFKNVGIAVIETWDKIKGWATLLSGPFLPVVMLIDIFKNLILEFNNIKQAFADGGFIEGMKAIGSAVLTGIVDPLKAAFSKLVMIKDALMPILIPIKDFFVNIGGIIFDGMVKVFDIALEKIMNIKNAALGIAGKIKSFFTGEDQTFRAETEAPNRREVEARQAVNFTGQLNIAGAPQGSTFESDTTGAPPIRTDMLGFSR